MAEVETQHAEEVRTKGKEAAAYWETDSGVELTGLEKAQKHTDKYLHKE